MSKLPSTRERLHQVLQALGASAKKSLGQNFLVSDIVISKIITQVQNQKPQAVFEIGPGAGALTDYLIQICEEKKATFQVIELDRAFADYWRQRGLQVFEEDALQFDWSKAVQTPRTILVSNLPYQISSSLVIELSVQDIAFDFMTLMFQKEVAQRIRAQARSADYGLLSVIAQNFWTIQLVSEAGPKDFDPPPRVASRVLGFQRKIVQMKSRTEFLDLVKSAFKQRRKLLKSNLSEYCAQHHISLDQVMQYLYEQGFKETVRAEELSPGQFLELYEHIDHSRK